MCEEALPSSAPISDESVGKKKTVEKIYESALSVGGVSSGAHENPLATKRIEQGKVKLHDSSVNHGQASRREYR